MTTSRDIADYYFEHHYDVAVEAIAAHKKVWGQKIDGRFGMSLTDDYVKYPHRRYGIDNDRYDWSILLRRDPVRMAWRGQGGALGGAGLGILSDGYTDGALYCAGWFDYTLSRPADL